MKDSYIEIRAWSSEDGWWLGSDERLKKVLYFKKYGFIAKLSYLYLKTFYQKVFVEISDVKGNQL